MSATKPASATELKNYCLRRLGYPAIDINVCDEQLDDLIDEAISHWQEFHYEGSAQNFVRIEITEAMKTAASSSSAIGGTNWSNVDNYIDMPPNTLGINHVYTSVGPSSVVPGNIFNIKYQIFLNDIYNFTHGQILHYYMTSQYLETLDWVTNSSQNRRVRWTTHQNRLYLDFDWTELEVGQYILVEGTFGVDPAVHTSAYNNEWLKGYVEALFQQQWGQNLSKYDGVQMLGGVTLNGRQILEDGRNKKEVLIQELHSRYELPPMDLVG